MRGNPLHDAYRSAEAAGYAVLLIVSMISLGLVVVPVVLLGLTPTGWVLAVVLLSLGLVLAVLAAAIGAAFCGGDEPVGGLHESASTDRHGDPVAQLPRREPEPEGERQRTAA